MNIINFKEKKIVFSEYENFFIDFEVAGSVVLYDRDLSLKEAKFDVDEAVRGAMSLDCSNALQFSIMIDSILRKQGYESETFVSSISSKIKSEKQAKKLGMVTGSESELSQEK